MRPSTGAKNITAAQKIFTGLIMSLRFERLIRVLASPLNKNIFVVRLSRKLKKGSTACGKP